MESNKQSQVNLPEEPLWNVEDAAAYLKIKLSRLRMAVNRGEIPYLKLGRLVRFDPESIHQWVRSKNNEGEKNELRL